MATPVETPQAAPVPTGAAPAPAPAPEAVQLAGGAPEAPPASPQIAVETAGQAPQSQGLPQQPSPDGVLTSGRGSNQDAPAPDPQTPAAPEDTPSPQGSSDPAQDAQQVENLPDWAQKIIKDARDDAAKARVNAKQAAADEARKALAQDIGKVLGIVDDDTPPEEQLNPDQLKQLLQGERATARQARVELAVLKAAQQPDASFNAAALLDSQAFLGAIADIDPTDAGAIQAKIAETIQASPWLAIQPAPLATPQTPAEPPVQPQQQAQQPAAPVAPPATPAAPPSGGQFAGGPGAQPQDLSSMSIDDFRRLRRNRTTS